MKHSIQSIPGAPDANSVGQQRPNDASDDADHDREPDRNGLSARGHQPAEGTDDQADDDAGDVTLSPVSGASLSCHIRSQTSYST
jgi:hypothetical protein